MADEGAQPGGETLLLQRLFQELNEAFAVTLDEGVNGSASASGEDALVPAKSDQVSVLRRRDPLRMCLLLRACLLPVPGIYPLICTLSTSLFIVCVRLVRTSLSKLQGVSHNVKKLDLHM